MKKKLNYTWMKYAEEEMLRVIYNIIHSLEDNTWNGIDEKTEYDPAIIDQHMELLKHAKLMYQHIKKARSEGQQDTLWLGIEYDDEIAQFDK